MTWYKHYIVNFYPIQSGTMKWSLQLSMFIFYTVKSHNSLDISSGLLVQNWLLDLKNVVRGHPERTANANTDFFYPLPLVLVCPYGHNPN